MFPRGLRVSPVVACACLLFAGTVALYLRSLGCGFSNYDDPRYILENAAIQSGFNAESLRWAFTQHDDFWNPLVRLSHILDVELFGMQAYGHHLQSILWHALNAVLAFLLLRRLTGALWTSAFCAALFAWHPLRVESVSWISERKDVVSVCFGLLTLLAYAAYAGRRAASLTAWRHYALALLAFAGALLSKSSMVALPGLLFLLDYWPLRRWPFAPALPENLKTPAEPTARLVVEKLPFAALAGVFVWITLYAQQSSENFTLELPLGARVANAVVSLPRYVGKFFWPFDLSTTYAHPIWWPVPVLVGAVFCVGATILVAWKLRRTQPWIAVGCLWFVGMLLPMIGLVQVGFQSIAERYTYFAILGWQIALLWSLRESLAPRLPRRLCAVAAALVLIACGVRTWDQQRHWHDPISLSRQAVAADPDNALAHAFLAYTYATSGLRVEARAECERALALDPRNKVALQTLAGIEAAENRVEAALACYRALISQGGELSVQTLEFANYLYALRRFEEAEPLYRNLAGHPKQGGLAALGLALVADELAGGDGQTAIAPLLAAHARHPDCVPLLENLAGLLTVNGRREEASALFARAVERSPSSAELARAHATFLRANGRLAEALAELDRAILRRPYDSALRHTRASLLADMGRREEALAACLAIVKENPGYAPAALEAGALYEQRGEPAQAASLYRQAVAARAAYVPAQLALARLAESQGRLAEADAAFEAALAAEPSNPSLHRRYAEVLARRRSFAAALTHYRRAVELAPDDAASRAGYGYMLVVTGNRAEAVAQWEAALRLQPDFPGLRAQLQKLRSRAR